MTESTQTFPRDNQTFLNVISTSFEKFIESGTSRSTAKLKPLHGAIAQDLATMLGDEYQIKSQGYGEDKEGSIVGRYIDKKVDITIFKDDKAIAGIGVKFVMQNYSQNSNNYFENMLGETANIRSGKCPYFQIFIILDRLPYYDKDKTIKHWERFTEHNITKYISLSNDDTNTFYHTPDKTLIFVVHIPDNENLRTCEEYMTYYKSNMSISISDEKYQAFGTNVILNDYPTFMKKVYHIIMAQ